MDTFLLILKYVSSVLAVGTAFAGSWFFEFTETDKATGKRTLTPWGRRGIAFAFVALVLAAATTILSDILGAEQTAIARAEAIQEREEATKFRTKFEKDQEAIQALLVPLNENINKLSLADREKVQDAVSGLENGDDLRTKYPELFTKMDNAATFGEVEGPAKEVMALEIARRVLDTPECADIKLQSFPTTSVLVGIEELPNFPNSKSAMSYSVQSDGIILQFSDLSNDADLENGYSIHFSDGKEIAVSCGVSSSQFGCTDNEVFRRSSLDLQTRLISKITSRSRTYDVPPETARNLQKVFSCLVP